MSIQNETSQQLSSTALEACISQAMKKLNTQREFDLCPYLPGKEGRLHHFAFGKMKKTQPSDLLKMIKENILERDNPKILDSKRKTRRKTKGLVEVHFKEAQINRLVKILKGSGDEELISMLSPRQTLPQIQKQMLNMVKAKEVDQDLWITYAKLVEEDKAALKAKQ